MGAIRDEFVARPWDPPGRHWPDRWSRFVGGRDRQAGGTWLAVDPSPERPAIAALLNGRPLGPQDDGAARPTRGDLVLRMLAGDGLPSGPELVPYDRFHLLLATASGTTLWTWDGEALARRPLRAPHHIIVNAGLDAAVDPLVAHFAPLLAAARDPEMGSGWGGWPELLAGDHLAGDDPRALVVAKTIDERPYGTTSSSMVAIGRDGAVRYAFTPTPADSASWSDVL